MTNKMPNFFHWTLEIGSDTWHTNKVLVESFLNEQSMNPRFRSSLRDFTNNFIMQVNIGYKFFAPHS